MIDHKILESHEGMFGIITVGKSFFPMRYWIRIKDEIEGQVFADQDGHPSAISASRYLYAFILLAWHFSASTGLMLGLGAGVGAVMLLALFPTLSLTVVEIDPQMIRLARKHFPLITLFEEQERLRIIQDDAINYVRRCDDRYSFALIDLFSGDESSEHNIALLRDVESVAPYFMANMITTEAGRQTIPEDHIWIRTSPGSCILPSNWMLTNMRNYSPDIVFFELFSEPNYDKSAAKTANQYFQFILSQVSASYFY